jgi:hypothetical protein
MILTVSVIWGEDRDSVKVTSLEQLYHEISQHDPSVPVSIEFINQSNPQDCLYECVTATVDQ